MPMLLAVSPRRIDCMSGRVQLASLIFWMVLKSPSARSEAARAATANGTARLGAKVGQPETGSGSCGTTSDTCASENGTRPISPAAT